MQRRTPQRAAIRDVIRDMGRPLSPAEILALARSRVAGLGLATVYRTLKQLAARREITPVDIPGGPPRYEIAGKGHHHHFSCRQCGRLYEAHGCTGDIQALVPPGFEADGHEVILYGRCAACLRARPGRRSHG